MDADKFQTPVIIVHGGAGKRNCTVPVKSAVSKGLCDAAKRGYEILKSEDGTAVSAVVEAISLLEDDENFNAGFGSKLNRDCNIQMDAMVMDGKTLKFGGVVSVSDVANPVRLARLVMDKTDQCILCATKAEEFARKMGIPSVSRDQLLCERAISLYNEALAAEKGEITEQMVEAVESHDTVGAVALDRHGNVACAASTGGLNFSMPGRVGDCALPGSGGYADNYSGACVTSGKGEAIMRVNLAMKALTLLENGQTPREATKNAVHSMLDRVGGYSGIILLDKHGNTGLYCSQNWMCYAHIKDDVVRYGIHPDQSKYEQL